MQSLRMIAVATSVAGMLTMGANTAGADGMPGGRASAAVIDTWTGRNVGIYYGAGMGSIDASASYQSVSTFNAPAFASTSTTRESFSGHGDITGSVVDVFAGYNWQMGSLVWGAQLEGTVFSDLSFRARGSNNVAFTTVANGAVTAAGSQTNTAVLDDNLRSMITFAGRGGFLVGPNMLIYGLLGVAYGHFVLDEDTAGTSSKNRGQWELGYMVGAGLEHRLNPSWSIRAEYRLVQFDVVRSQAFSFSRTNTTSLVTETFSDSSRTRADVNLHLGKVGIAYKF